MVLGRGINVRSYDNAPDNVHDCSPTVTLSDSEPAMLQVGNARAVESEIHRVRIVLELPTRIAFVVRNIPNESPETVENDDPLHAVLEITMAERVSTL